MYRPDSDYKIFDQKVWWSDSWNAMDYGRDFDFAQTFSENFCLLSLDVPRMSLNIVQNENSDYVSFAGYNKNCYLIYTADQNEDCMYGSY